VDDPPCATYDSVSIERLIIGRNFGSVVAALAAPMPAFLANSPMIFGPSADWTWYPVRRNAHGILWYLTIYGKVSIIGNKESVWIP
jgi:hypothetical protein